MNANDVIKSLHLPFSTTVENTSLSRVCGSRCDLIITFESFREEAKKCSPNVIVIKNLMDKEEIKNKILAFLNEKGILQKGQ